MRWAHSIGIRAPKTVERADNGPTPGWVIRRWASGWACAASSIWSSGPLMGIQPAQERGHFTCSRAPYKGPFGRLTRALDGGRQSMVRSAVSVRSSSRATAVTDLPLSRTIRTACALNSFVNARRLRLAMTHSYRTFVRSGVSTKPGQVQHRQQRLRTVQGLNLGLLIDAQHERLIRRVEVEPHDVSHL